MQISHLLALIVVLFMACKTSKNSTDNAKENMNTITFDRLTSGEYCGVDEAQQMLITSNDDWSKLWTEVHKNQIPAPEALTIDFSKKWVVACFMGMKSSGGHKIEIKRIELSDDQIIVQTTEYAPGRNCISTMALTQPYVLVLIDHQKVEKITTESNLKREDC